MKLLNASGMAAGYTLGLDIDARERLVVAVKGTFSLPRRGETAPPRLLEEQVPLADADTFTGEPGRSATMVECDFAPMKPRCDILLNGSAYARGGGLAQRVVVGLQFGAMQKAFTVLGDRVWEAGATGAAPSQPRPFTRLPISYDNAFGGVDDFSPFAEEHRTYLPNPVGRGWHRLTQRELVDGKPVSNTEEQSDPVTRPNGNHRPMAFGPVGRTWPHRVACAGTYDQAWLDDMFPFLPRDFDPRYFNCAPEDQQVDPPRGGEKVLLVNVTEDGRREFGFPQTELPIVFRRRRGGHVDAQGTIDTVLFEPDKERFSVTWRTSLPLERDIHEIAQVTVGRMSGGWTRAADRGKTYYRSIADLVREQGIPSAGRAGTPDPRPKEPAG